MTLDREAAAELAEAIRRRVAQRVDDARRRRETNRQARTAKQARRTAGLKSRHARKIRRSEEGPRQ